MFPRYFVELLEKQKERKTRMKQLRKIDIPQEAFLEVMRGQE